MGREAAGALARTRDRASRALERANRAGEAAVYAERCSRRGPAFLSETMARVAAIQRRNQLRHLAVARLNAAYAARLQTSMEQSGGAFLAAVASISRGGRVVLSLSGNEQTEALVTAPDALAQAACDLERRCGEGPATDAVALRALVRVFDDLATMWPLYGPAVHQIGIHAVSAAPLCLPGSCFGTVIALNPYPDGRGNGLRADHLADALVDTLTYDDIPAGRDGLPAMPLPDGDQALMHCAAGMVAEQSWLNAADAIALIRARAFADSQPVSAIAALIVSHRLQLTIPDWARHEPAGNPAVTGLG